MHEYLYRYLCLYTCFELIKDVSSCVNPIVKFIVNLGIRYDCFNHSGKIYHNRIKWKVPSVNL